MLSKNPNNASSSGVGSSKGLPACAWISLTLEEQLTNFQANFERIVRECYSIQHSPNDAFLESIVKVVKALRIDPWVDIEGLLHQGPQKYGALQGATPLHWAILMDDRTMVQYILTSRKVDINAWDLFGVQTALNYAIVGGNRDIVEDLLEHKADVCISEYGGSALSYMVHHKNSMFDILQKVLANNVNMYNKSKNTTLHYAAWKGATDVVRYLLNQDADVNVSNVFGNTPLHCAIEEGYLDVATCLLQHNADVHASNRLECSPLHIAAIKGNTNIISFLLEHNANIEVVDWAGCTPLVYSIMHQNIDTFNELIANGADVHVKDKKDNNTLHFAIQAHYKEMYNMMEIVKVLQEHDVDANAKNSKGYSPFFIAVFEGNIDVLTELLKSKEKIKLMDECKGQTAIQIAFDYSHEHIKRALLECDDISRYVSDLYRDRQVYVDAANAILVGAALIASVTFASWLQPPLGYTTPYLDLAPSSSDINYVDVQHNVSLRGFWIFNTLSFYFAIGTVVFGARSVLPRRHMFIKAIVVKLHQNLLVTSILLACSVFCVIIAFGIAGCIVLTPTLKSQWYMIVPTIFGGFVYLVSLVLLFKSIVEDNLEKKRNISCIPEY